MVNAANGFYLIDVVVSQSQRDAQYRLIRRPGGLFTGNQKSRLKIEGSGYWLEL